MSDPRPTSYWNYLKLDPLLGLQGGIPENEDALDGEEVLFITVHQVFELWFKLVLRELRAARDLFQPDAVREQELSGAVASMRRIQTIFRTATQHFEVVETIGLREYLEFRDSLMPASGFQSFQLRQIEILFGLEEDDRVPLGPKSSHLSALKEPDGSESAAYKAVQAQLADQPTLRAAIEGWLARTPIDGVPHDDPGADQALDRFINGYLEAHGAEIDRSLEHAEAIARTDKERERLRGMYSAQKSATHGFFHPTEEEGGRHRARVRAAIVFIETYRDLPLLAWPREVLASLLEVEQAFLIFRQRHARMVERVIGRRAGTGGSEGVDYLDRTALAYRIFGDLWAVRTLMIRPAATPPLEREGYYGFKSGTQQGGQATDVPNHDPGS